MKKIFIHSVARITDAMVPIQIRIGPKTYKGVLIVDKHLVYVILNYSPCLYLFMLPESLIFRITDTICRKKVI